MEKGSGPSNGSSASAGGSTIDALVRDLAGLEPGGAAVARAADVLEAMVRDPHCGVVLTLSGAMTVAKMGLLITEMIERGLVHVVVSTGALIAHGFVEGVGGVHFKADPARGDEENYRHGYNRVYDTLELERNLDDLFAILCEVLEDQPRDAPLCSRALHALVGRHLVEKRSGRGILQAAHRRGVPIFVPAFTDSELGIDFSIHNVLRQGKGLPPLRYDPFLDLEYFVHWACLQETMGIFTVGGGVPRNWAQEVGPYVELLQGRGAPGGPPVRRYKYGVRLCPEPVHWGGLSGCTYSEGVSWGKFEPKSSGGRHAEVPSDATVAWPLVLGAVLERLARDPAPPKQIPYPQPGVRPPWLPRQ